MGQGNGFNHFLPGNHLNGFYYKTRFKPNPMQHTFHKLWIHACWSTKDREPLLHAEAARGISRFMGQELRELNCPPRIIRALPDHIHCLYLLNPLRSTAEVIKQIKGSSAHYINHNNIISERFSWQQGYCAYSVSESRLEQMTTFIRDQQQYHQAKTYQQEFETMMRLYGFEAPF